MANKEIQYCDDCAKQLDEVNTFAVSSLKRDITSANKGESATMCAVCWLKHHRHRVRPSKGSNH